MSNEDIIRITLEDVENTAATSGGADPGAFDWSAIDTPTASKEPVDIILVIDTSGSMGASDYAPNRLQTAKEAAMLFTRRKVMQNYNDRVGVIGFGGSPVVIQQLDNNLEKVAKSIERLSITHSGTMIGSALRAAEGELQRGKGTRKQAIVLLSDGGDKYDSSKPVNVANSLYGIIVFTVGMGTIKGGMVKLPHGTQKVFLNESLLKQIARATNGEYMYAPDVSTLQRIYRSLADF